MSEWLPPELWPLAPTYDGRDVFPPPGAVLFTLDDDPHACPGALYAPKYPARAAAWIVNDYDNRPFRITAERDSEVIGRFSWTPVKGWHIVSDPKGLIAALWRL